MLAPVLIDAAYSAYDAFRDVLNKMLGKFEFGLKVLWDRDQIIREIEEEEPEAEEGEEIEGEAGEAAEDEGADEAEDEGGE